MKNLMFAFLALNLSFTAIASKGGGGGDASEERVNEIRSDLLKWINKGGAKDLELPSAVSYGQYVDLMTDILQPKKVVIGFVEKDHASNKELQVSVGGIPKTCRGFYSEVDSKPHILCNTSRFKATSESQQYSLIHHEYAGLVSLESNEGAASDYAISSQVTDYLEAKVVLKLAVKKIARNVDPETDKNEAQKACAIKKNEYVAQRFEKAKKGIEVKARMAVEKLYLKNKLEKIKSIELISNTVSPWTWVEFKDQYQDAHKYQYTEIKLTYKIQAGNDSATLEFSAQIRHTGLYVEKANIFDVTDALGRFKERRLTCSLKLDNLERSPDSPNLSWLEKNMNSISYYSLSNKETGSTVDSDHIEDEIYINDIQLGFLL